jgi:hypothetical protein
MSGCLPVAGIVQISAKSYQICVNFPHPVKHLDAIMQIRQTQNPERLLYACHILVSLIIALG